MKKLFWIGCNLWLIAAVHAQQPVSGNSSGMPARDVVSKKNDHAGKDLNENTWLWEISGNGLQKSSYLFGTMHLLCAEDARLSDSLENIIRRSELIYFEIDMDNITEMMGALKYLKMNDNKKLADLLTPEEYQKVQDYFKKNQLMMPLQMMESFKPYLISSLIEEQRMTCALKGGMEQLIMNEAKPYKKEIRGLETVQFQASVFDSIPYEQQAKELVKYIDSAGKNTLVEQELVNVYKQQDLNKIEELTKNEGGGVGEFIDLLLYNRNADWVQKMKGLLPGNSILFAVGAAHLPGEKGVIGLLRKNGYTVTPVRNVWKPGTPGKVESTPVVGHLPGSSLSLSAN